MKDQNEKAIEKPFNQTSRGIQLKDFNDLWQFAGKMIEAQIAPKGLNQAAVMMILEAGAEFGVAPLMSFDCFYVVNGKIATTADGMRAVVEASGMAEYIEEGFQPDKENPYGWCRTKRKGRDNVVERTFSWTDAQRAGFGNKDNYRKFHQRMLQHRATTFCLRDTYADILKGIRTIDELVEVHQEGKDVEPTLMPKNLAEFKKAYANSTKPPPNQTYIQQKQEKPGEMVPGHHQNQKVPKNGFKGPSEVDPEKERSTVVNIQECLDACNTKEEASGYWQSLPEETWQKVSEPVKAELAKYYNLTLDKLKTF